MYLAPRRSPSTSTSPSQNLSAVR
uniref:Uncharacterized protein n=1 Tax=Arundo donax TaxID=35708 RepID=A0A0A8ZTS2_ARUDO